MINVNEIFVQVKELLSKDKGGYIDSEEFTRMSKVAENQLWLFYVSQHEAAATVQESIRPFIAEAVVTIDAKGQVLLPTNYGHRLILWLQKSTSMWGTLTIEPIGMKYLEKSEVWGTLSTSVRAPNIGKKRVYWTYVAANKIQVYPTNAKPSVKIEYVRYPVWAVRGFTLDVVNDEENYNSGTSTNYEWLEADRSNLIDLILLQAGMSIRETEVTQFAAQHRAASQNVPLLQ